MTPKRPQASIAFLLASLPESKRQQILSGLSPKEKARLRYEWRFWARPNQLPPAGDWIHWLLLMGRGWGKTRTAAEFVRDEVGAEKVGRIALIGRTAGDVREVMVEGQSGLLNISPPGARPKFEPSKRRLTWPNGAVASLYYGESPDLLRGPEHDLYWADEIAAWKYPQECWDNLLMGLRLGARPRGVITTTPRPIPLIKARVKDPLTVVVRGSTFDNAANLPPTFLAELIEKYEGTRIGRQELYAEVLEDVEGALWNLALLERNRVREAPELARVVVAIDPAVTAKEGSDETGIIVGGSNKEQHAYILEDRSGRFSPDGWAKEALDAYEKHDADCIVAEVNNGGDLVEKVIQDAARSRGYEVRIKKVHAARGKETRAEPVVALDERGRLHHVGSFPQLEDQMCSFVPGEKRKGSPDRMDARVWCATELLIGKKAPVIAAPGGIGGPSPWSGIGAAPAFGLEVGHNLFGGPTGWSAMR